MAALRVLRPALRRLAGRVGPALPERVQAKLLAARSWVADGVAVGLPRWERVLVLAPHPDDESLGCGGTIALLADAGASVTVALVSDGEATLGASGPRADVGRARRAEAERAVALLGVEALRPLGFPDGALAGQVDAIGRRLAGLLADLRPEVVMLPWFLDASDDHRAVNVALAAAAPSEDVEVWGAELWTPLPPNRLVDITSVLDRKAAAIAAHVTAHQAFDLSAMLGLNRYRALKGLRGQGHAEAFLTALGPQYAALVREALVLQDGRIRARR